MQRSTFFRFDDKMRYSSPPQLSPLVAIRLSPEETLGNSPISVAVRESEKCCFARGRKGFFALSPRLIWAAASLSLLLFLRASLLHP